MSRWHIDSRRTSFFVSFRPGLPGIGLRVRGVTGDFEATLDAEGRPDLSLGLEGEFQMAVDDLRLGVPLLDRAVRAFLRGEDAVAVQGRMGEVQPVDEDRYRFGIHLEVHGNRNRIEAVGHTVRHEDGSVQVKGRSEVDPRGFGFPIPRLVPLQCLTAWDLRMLPAD